MFRAPHGREDSEVDQGQETEYWQCQRLRLHCKFLGRLSAHPENKPTCPVLRLIERRAAIQPRHVSKTAIDCVSQGSQRLEISKIPIQIAATFVRVSLVPLPNAKHLFVSNLQGAEQHCSPMSPAHALECDATHGVTMIPTLTNCYSCSSRACSGC
jgi:hypothetical protein